MTSHRPPRSPENPESIFAGDSSLARIMRDAMSGGGGLVLETRNVSTAGSAGAMGEHVAISVVDTGHGMSAETVARAPA